MHIHALCSALQRAAHFADELVRPVNAVDLKSPRNASAVSKREENRQDEGPAYAVKTETKSSGLWCW